MELVNKLKDNLKQLNRWSIIIIFLFLLLFGLFIFVILLNPSDGNENYSSTLNGITSKLVRTEDDIIFYQNEYYVSVNYSSNAYVDQIYTLSLLLEVLKNELNYSLYLSQINIKLHYLDTTNENDQYIHSVFPDIYLSEEPVYNQEISFSFPNMKTGSWNLYLVCCLPESEPEIDEEVVIYFPITVFETSTIDKVMSINSLLIIIPSIMLIVFLRRNNFFF